MTTHKLSESTNPFAFPVVLWALVALASISMASGATTLSAQTVTDLYGFTSDGSAQNPENVTPTQARNGEIYGTTVGPTYGSVFSLQTSGTETSFFHSMTLTARVHTPG